MTRLSSRLSVAGCLAAAAFAVTACGGSSHSATSATVVTSGAGSGPPVAASTGAASGTTAPASSGAATSPTGPGAGSAPAASPPPTAHTAAPGTKTVTDQADRVSLDVPTGWTTITGAAELRALVKRGVAADPALAKLFPQLENEFSSGAKLASLNLGTGGFADNVNLVVRPANGATPSQVTEAEPALRTRLQQTAGISGLVFADVKATDGGPALRDTYTLRLPGLASVLHGQQLYVIRGETVYIATVTTAGADPAAAPILSTLRFG